MRYENNNAIPVKFCFVLEWAVWCFFMMAVLVPTSVGGEEQLTRFLSRCIILSAS